MSGVVSSDAEHLDPAAHGPRPRLADAALDGVAPSARRASHLSASGGTLVTPTSITTTTIGRQKASWQSQRRGISEEE